MNIALFDFDGTITNADMFTQFLNFSATKRRSPFAKLALSPFYLLYKLGVIPAPTMRPIASYVAFWGREASDVAALGEQYAQHVVPRFLRQEALEQLDWHKQNGDQIVIVSASLDVYLKPWCAQHGFALVCSELNVHQGKFTGRYRDGDCSSEDKPRLIRTQFDLSQFDKIYAYGDTREDHAMLNLADEAYLNWLPYAKNSG
uniref:HAD-IB family hydrolase n=1 Tax=Thaumasiovibrio occultus TaxID=1891184 RepID=UPI000B35A0A7|nr:HAD-IB family hydrolase [Thaumasiovibrio occultus]